MKATESSINTEIAVGEVFADQYVVEIYLTETEMETMAETWIYTKNTQEVVDDIVDEGLDIIESKNIHYYESEYELEKVARPVVKHKYTHMQAME